MEIKNRFVGPNGEFEPSEQPEEGKVTIQYLEELLEWIFYHDNISKEEKKDLILGIEQQIQTILNGMSSMKINYKPTWSLKQ